MTLQTESGRNAPVLPYRLAIFDLDGTLLDTLDDLADAVNYALGICGFPVHSRPEIRRILGNGMRNLIQRSVPEGAKEEWEKVFRVFVPYYEAHCREKTGPYAGIPETLRALRNAGVKTAVISNKADPAVQILIRDYFPDLFDYIAGEKPGIRRKPEPDAVDRCLETLAVPREDAVYIGDSEVDVHTAVNADVDGLIVAWGFRDEPELAEVIRGVSRRDAEKSRFRIVRTADALQRALLPENRT